MLTKPSLVLRIAIGKGIGFIIGLIGFIFLAYLTPDTGILFRWGILLWYITFGAIIGVFGVFTYHPVLKLPMPWWVQAPLIGAWLNFVLALLTYGDMQEFMHQIFGADGFMVSPFWFALEGAIVGLLIGYFATRFGGEGKETVDN